MKVLTVIGARPQFIKTAMVSRTISQYNLKSIAEPIQEVIVHTGQHYDVNMSDIFFEEMQIPLPNYQLGIGGGTHGSMTGQMLEKIEEVIFHEKPDIVLVYGDTNSTLAGALAAVKLHIPVAHIEAGLRSFNMCMPEEVNRILTDKISRWLFCPTETAVNNLKDEGYLKHKQASVINVGDVMYDAALFYQTIAQPTNIIKSLINQLNNGFYLATVHRAENTDSPARLNNIMAALQEISQNIPVVLPLHPRTQKLLKNEILHPIQIIEPVGYFDMLTLLSSCNGVLTDSGGLQKEAYFFKRPCITFREETEWVELVNNGFNILAGNDKSKILEAEESIRNCQLDYSLNLYGKGDTAQKIVHHLLSTIS